MQGTKVVSRFRLDTVPSRMCKRSFSSSLPSSLASKLLLQRHKTFIEQGLGNSKHQYSNPSRIMQETKNRNFDGFLYMSSAVITIFGLMYASVPMYRMFCQETGFGGTVKTSASLNPETLKPVPGASPVEISFTSDTSKSLPWTFVPEQKSIKVIPGQTALAFYKARNNGDRPIIGISTYNVIPSKAAQYFNKIQCFCFEEQRLEPGEEVDMPVFFYLDPEYAYDPGMDAVEEILLGYTFFNSKSQTLDK